MSFEDVKKGALQLPWAERLKLAQVMLGSLEEKPPAPLPAPSEAEPANPLPSPAHSQRSIPLPNPVHIPAPLPRKVNLDEGVAESFQRLRRALEQTVEIQNAP